MPRSKVRASDRTKGKSKESKVSKADQKKGKKVTKSELRFIEKTDIRTQNFRDREEKRSRERAASAKTDSGLAGGKRKAKDEKNPRGERGRSAGKGRLSSDDRESVDSIRYSTDNQPSTSQALQLETSTYNATSPSRGRQRDNLQRTERREVSIAKPKTEASTEINKRTPVSPNIKVVEKAPSNIKTKGEASSNIKTKGEASSNIKTKAEAPSNIKTKGEAPSNIKTKDEAPSAAKVKREAPSNTRTKVDAPSGNKTKEENPPSTRTKPEALSNKKTKSDILLSTKIGEDGSPGPISGTKSPSNSKRTTGASTSDKKGHNSPLNKTGKDVLGNNKTRKVTYSIAEIEIEDSPNTKRVGGTLSHTSSDGEAPFITKTKNKSPTKTKANVDFPPNTKSIRDTPSNIKTRKGEHSNNRMKVDVHFNNETSEETTFNSSTWEGETPSDTETRKEAFSKSKIRGENVTNKTKREGYPSNKVWTEVHFNTEETPFSNRTWLETPSCIKTKRDDQSSRKRKDGHSSNKTGTEVHFDSDISEETPIKSTTGKAPSNTKTKGEDPSNNKTKKYITSSKRTGSKAKPNTEEQEQVSSSSCIGEVPCKKNTEREAPSNNRRRKDTLTSTKTGEETTSKANTKGVTTDTKVLEDTLSATKIAQFTNKMVTDVSFISRTGEEIPFSSNHNRKSTSAKTQQTESRDGRNKVEPSGKHRRRNGDMKNIEEQDIKSRSLSSSSVKEEKSRGDERGDTRARSATQNKTKRQQKTDTKPHGQKGVWGMRKKKVSSPENSSAEETSELKVNIPVIAHIPVPATHDSESDGERVVGALDDSDDERSSLASSEEEKARETLSIKSRSSREQQREGESGDEESTSSTSSSESSEEKSAMKEKNIGKSEEDDEDDSEEEREVDPEQKENMEDVEDDSDEEVIAKVEGEQKQVANEMVETEDEKDSDEDEDDTDERSVKTQEESSEETESDGKSKEASDSEDESEDKSEAEKTSEQMKHNSRAGGVLLPFRKPLPSGVKAKLLNIRLGTASGDLVNNSRFGKGLGNLTPSSQPSSESETTCEKSSNSVKDKGQRTSHSRRRREAKVEIPVKKMHIFTAQSHIITNLRRRQKAARKTLLNRREEDQHLTTTNVLGNPEKEAAVLSEEDINLELKVSSCSTVSSHSLENELSTKVAMGKEVQNEGKDTQTKQEDHQNEDKEMVQGKEEEKMATMSGQKDGKTACSISAFRRVTGWLRRVPPKKSNLKERLASVARAIGITDWLFRTFRKKKKQRKCELKRRTAMRILSTSRMVNQHNQAALGGSSIGKNHKDQDKENEELGCAEKGCEDKCGQQNADSPTESMRQVSEHSEIEESAVTGDAKYAIVFPRIHHLAKTIKISPAVQRSIRSTGQRVIVSVQPASSNRIPERDVKDSPNIHQKQPESPVPAVSPRYHPIQMIKSRQKANQTAQSSEGGLRSNCLSKLGPLREEQGDIHSLEAQSVPQEGTELHDSNSASPKEEEEEAEQGPFYQATTHVHWAQSMPGRGDPTSWLSSETLLPRLTIENLSKWTIYQDLPHSKQRQTIQHPRDRWEAEDSTEDLLQMSMSKKQAWAGEDSPEVEEVSDLSFLEDVCESAILLCLKKRFHRNAIYHTDCCNVSGVWENSLGSVLRLSVESSYLSGTLQTSVESSAGAAGEGMLGVVSGVLGAGKQPTFTMSVSWDGGSASAWAGQCFWRSRGPILRTMWLMRTEVSTEKENWQATRIGEDTFHPKRSHKD